MATELPKASQQEWQGVLEKLIVFTQASEALVSSLKSALVGDDGPDEKRKGEADDTVSEDAIKGVCVCKSKTKIPKHPPTCQSTESANEKPSNESVKIKPTSAKKDPGVQKRPSKHKSPKKVQSKSNSDLPDNKKQLVKLSTVRSSLKNIHVELSKIIERVDDLEKCIKGTDERQTTPEFSAASNMFRQILDQTNNMDQGYLQESPSEAECGPCSPRSNRQPGQIRPQMAMNSQRNVDFSGMNQGMMPQSVSRSPMNQGMMDDPRYQPMMNQGMNAQSGYGMNPIPPSGMRNPSPGRMQTPMGQQQMQQYPSSGCGPCRPRPKSASKSANLAHNQGMIEQSRGQSRCGPCSRTF